MAAAQEVDTKEIEIYIKSILISRPTSTNANLLQRELEDELGRPFPLRQLGFRTFVDYLRSIPNVVQLEPHNSSNPNVYPVASKLSQHVDQLVSRQRVAPSKKRGVSRRGSYNSRPAPVRRRPTSLRQSCSRPLVSRPAPPAVRPNQVDPPHNVQHVNQKFLENILWDLAKQLAVSWKNGIDVRELEGHLARNYDQRDLARHGIHRAEDLLSHAEAFIERGDTKVYPKLTVGSNNTNHSREANCIPAGLEDDFEDDDDWFYDDEVYDEEVYNEEAAKDSEEELSNHVINLLSKKAPGSNENGSSSRSPMPEGETSRVNVREKNLYQDDDTLNESNISDAMIKNFRHILSKHQDGIWASQLQQLYFDQFRVSLDPQDLGHMSMISLASSLPSVFSYCREGLHDWKLYDARYVTQDSLDAQGNGGDIPLKDNELYIPQTIIEKIKKLLDDNPGGFRSTDLLQLYADTFRKPLDLECLGFNTLEEFLMILNNDVTLKKALNYYLLFPKHKLVSHEALLPSKPDEGLNLPPEALGVPIPEGVLWLDEEIPLQELPPVVMDPDPDKPLLEMEVRVAEVISPVFFYITLGSMYEELEKMMDDLEKFYVWEEAKFKIPPNYVVMNLYCAAKYEGFWHRAKITKKRSSGDVEIEYIDYGTPATVKDSELRYLSKEFAYLPAQAICAKCMGVKPVNDETKFPQHVCEQFLSLVEGKRLLAYVYQVAQRVRFKKEKMQLEVILFDVENPDQERVINDYLIDKGLAWPINQVQDPTPEVQLSDENPLLQNDLVSLQAVNPSESLQSDSLLPLESVSSPHLDNASTSLPTSSVVELIKSLLNDLTSPLPSPRIPSSSLQPNKNLQEEKKTRRPPPGFKKIPDNPGFDLSSPDYSTAKMPSSRTNPTNSMSSEEQQNLLINNFYLMNGPQMLPQFFLQEHFLQNFNPNPSNMPLSGPPLFQTHQNGNQRSLTYGSIVPPSNAYHIPETNMYRQQEFCSGAPVPSSYFQVNPAPGPMFPVMMNAPVPFPDPFMSFYQPIPNMAAHRFSNPQGYAQGDFLFPAPPVQKSGHSSPSPVLAKTTSTPPPATPRPGSTPSPAFTPITVPEWPPANLPASFTSAPTKTNTASCSHHSLPASSTKSGPPEANQIPRPCTPLTPASAEVANICNSSRPNSNSSASHKSGSRSANSQNTSSPIDNTLCQLQDNTNPLLNSQSNSQTSESVKENVISNLKSETIDHDCKESSNLSVDKECYPERQLEMKNIFLAPDIVKEILYPSPTPSPERLYSAISSPVDSLMCTSPMKEESSDDYASAPENVEEAKHQLANLTLAEQDPLPAMKTPRDRSEDIPDSWENLDLDDTPARAVNFNIDFSQPLDLIFKNMENETTFKKNSPVEKSIMDVTNQESPLKIQAPVNWKDVFNPDIINISESNNNNNTTKENSLNNTKLAIKKIPVQEIEVQEKCFHLLYIQNKTPAVIALEFFKQFVTKNIPQVSEKVLEATNNKMYYLTKSEHPTILAELDKIAEFSGGLSKKTVLRLNKVRVINLSDIPECLKVLNAFNKPLLDDFQKIAIEL